MSSATPPHEPLAAAADAAVGEQPRWCDRCGGALGSGGGTDAHAACRAARALEPPRYCPSCRRRMKVQVLPAGWVAACVEHGQTRSR